MALPWPLANTNYSDRFALVEVGQNSRESLTIYLWLRGMEKTVVADVCEEQSLLRCIKNTRQRGCQLIIAIDVFSPEATRVASQDCKHMVRPHAVQSWMAPLATPKLPSSEPLRPTRFMASTCSLLSISSMTWLFKSS